MPSLPTGTVTFLFTDIEGSTRLLQSLGDTRATDVFEEHRRLLRQAIATSGGQELQDQGDGFLFVFQRAHDALLAVVAAQRAITTHPWPDGAGLRVRMGLHTGEPVATPDGYVGVDVHRAARISAAGHGGQILLSQTTHDLIDRQLPEGVGFRDLGAYRLKDLQLPERIFQLLHPNLPADFPALKSLATLPNNLPIQLTSFIGRDRELAKVKRLVKTARLLTLTGVGGSGKTRLALQAAADLLDDFPDGAWLVELAPLADPGLVPQTAASVLKVTEQEDQPLLTTLIEHLRSKQTLLILDNCEHLLSAAAALVDALLRACPHLRVIATSREALGITGETTTPVPSLALPDLRQLPPLETLEQYEAVRLFIDRAMLVQQTFSLTPANAPAVAQLCHRLDGMPLAIELAVARVKVLPPEEIAARLSDRFRLLTGGSRTALPRHQTLQATMDWSYNLLSEAERVLLRRLAVFAGGFSLEAAEAVCTGDGIQPHEILDLVTHLVEKSLVLAQPENGDIRYGMLETVRHYARERLLESGEGDAVRRNHRDFFLGLVEQYSSDAGTVRDPSWMERFARDHDNLRTAWDWSMKAGDLEAALRMGGELWWFWEVRGYWQEGHARLESALNATQEVSSTARADALHGAGRLAWFQGDPARATEWLEEAADASRRLDYKPGLGRALFTMGIVARRGHLARAKALLEEAVAVGRELGNRWMITNRLAWLWPLVYQQGDYARATALAQECATISRGGGLHPVSVAFGRRAEAWMARREGDYGRAMARCEEALALSREFAGGRVMNVAWALAELGELVREQGDCERATFIYEESLALAREPGTKEYIAVSLNGLAGLARDLGDFARAMALHQESLALGKAIDDSRIVASSLHGLGIAARNQGDLDRAAAWLEESLRVYRDTGNRVGEAETLHVLGLVACDRGDHERAADLIHQSLRLLRGGAARLTLVRLLEGLAAIAAARGQYEQSARLFGTVAATREAMGTPRPPTDRAEHDHILVALRNGLEDAEFNEGWAEGQATPLEKAIEETLNEGGRRR